MKTNKNTKTAASAGPIVCRVHLWENWTTRCCQGLSVLELIRYRHTGERGGGGNKEGFAEVVTLSGIIPTDVSQTPHGPVLNPVPLPHA
ncbi:hypothetical protein EYF80_033546 [Liparis tanakae]|uniref:Uncharacterized protein n=1 Tax=Liparis tanakae TaxID=230148 RepID=A0A4Z2GU31_9TELE|nr:hypothetical protein EYF80_033546 [Liparis tanakae]